jgi:hypothetical protein
LSKKKRSRPNIPEATLRRYAPGQSGSANRVKGDEDFNPDYSHIKTDLKRIGFLGASFLGILIILSFIL